MIRSFRDWWRRPLRPRDRVGAVLIGSLGGLWAVVLGRLFLGPMPAPLATVAYWGIGGLMIGAFLGIAFPRATSVVFFPFSMFGISGS